MATDGITPSPCDHEIFKNGQTVAALSGSSNAIENWVKAVARKANARVDWHYSGGTANVLHLGDIDSRNRVHQAMLDLQPKLKGRIIRIFTSSEPGLYRNGVTPVPAGTIAGFYEGGHGSTYVVGGN